MGDLFDSLQRSQGSLNDFENVVRALQAKKKREEDFQRLKQALSPRTDYVTDESSRRPMGYETVSPQQEVPIDQGITLPSGRPFNVAPIQIPERSQAIPSPAGVKEVQREPDLNNIDTIAQLYDITGGTPSEALQAYQRPRMAEEGFQRQLRLKQAENLSDFEKERLKSGLDEQRQLRLEREKARLRPKPNRNDLAYYLEKNDGDVDAAVEEWQADRLALRQAGNRRYGAGGRLSKEQFNAVEKERQKLTEETYKLGQQISLLGIGYKLDPGTKEKIKIGSAEQQALTNTLTNQLKSRQRRLQEIATQLGGEYVAPSDNSNNAGPEAGDVEDGYRFKGGDPADPNSWEKVLED